MEYEFQGFIAAVESINLSDCGLTEATPRHGDSKKCGWENIETDVAGFTALCSVLGKVRTVILANCGLGPGSIAELSKAFTNADAATTSLNMSGSNFGDITEHLQATLVADGVVVECRLGETLSKETFEYRGRIATTVPITSESSRTNTSDLDKVVALSHRGGCSITKKLDRVRTAGAVALILVNTDDHGLIKLHAEDSTIPIIAVRSCDGQLLEQAAEIVLVIDRKPCTLRLLCEALKTSHVTDVDISSCGLGWPAMEIWSNYLPELKSLTSLDLSMNPLQNHSQNDTVATDLGAVLSASSLKCLIIGRKRTRLHVNELEVTELNLRQQNLTPTEATLVGATILTLPAIGRLNLSGNMITGSNLGGWEKEFDKKVDDFLPFLDALLHLKNPIELDLSNCCLGDSGVAYVGAVFQLGGRLSSLTIDSTGSNGSPKTYTLTASG